MIIDSEARRVVDGCFSEFFAANKNPGIQFAICHGGRVLHAGSLGQRSINPDLSFASDSVSRIASMTKSFATVATLRLRDQGLVVLDAPLRSIVPHIQLVEPFASATLADLMSMRLDLPSDDPWADRLLGATRQEIDPYFQSPVLLAGFGSSVCAYSNLSYFLLGRIIAHVSERSALDYITHEILVPLGLTDTVWNISGEHEGRVTRGYRVDCSPAKEEESFICRSDCAVFGGLWSTVSDLAVWLEFLRADNSGPKSWDLVLSRASRREMRRPLSKYEDKTVKSIISGQPFRIKADYGFGLVRSCVEGSEYISHSGGLPGYGSHMRVHTESGLGAVLLGNGTYCNASEPCISALQYLVGRMDTEAQRRSELVRQVGTQLAEFIRSGALELPEELFAYNFWQDNLPDNFRREASKRLAELGDNAVTNSIFCTSGYQGEIVFSGSSGSARVEFLLAPHLPARVQSLEWLR